MGKSLDQNGVLYLWNKIKSIFVTKEAGKGLSTNDYSTAEKNKLSGVASGAEVNVQSDWSVTDTASDAFIKNKPTSMPANGGNAATVGGHTVAIDVPANAKFSDTTYSDMKGASADTAGAMVSFRSQLLVLRLSICAVMGRGNPRPILPILWPQRQKMAL